MPHANTDPSHVVWALGAALVIVNAIVCVAAARADGLTRGQIVVHTAVVWLIPLIGAGMVGTFLWSEAHPPPLPQQTSHSGEAPAASGHSTDPGDRSP